jgi:hypothetical protein
LNLYQRIAIVKLGGTEKLFLEPYSIVGSTIALGPRDVFYPITALNGRRSLHFFKVLTNESVHFSAISWKI